MTTEPTPEQPSNEVTDAAVVATPAVSWRRYDCDDKQNTTPKAYEWVWIVDEQEDDREPQLGYFDGYTFRLAGGSSDCFISWWSRITYPEAPAPDVREVHPAVLAVQREASLNDYDAARVAIALVKWLARTPTATDDHWTDRNLPDLAHEIDVSL